MDRNYTNNAAASPLDCLLEQLRSIALDGGYTVEDAVDAARAQNVLEATAGDVLIAAQLYWDDFLATRQQQQQQQHAARHPAMAEHNDYRQPPHRGRPAAARHRPHHDDSDEDHGMLGQHNNHAVGSDTEDHDQHEADRRSMFNINHPGGARNEDSDADAANPQERVVAAARRRGMRAIAAANENPNQPNDEEDDDDNDDDDAYADEDMDDNDNGDEDGMDNMNDDAVAWVRRRRRRRNGPAARRGLASISDDEGNINNNDGGTSSSRNLRDRRKSGRPSRKSSSNNSNTHDAVEAHKKRRKLQDDGTSDPVAGGASKMDSDDKNDNEEEYSEERGYISDNDWLWDALDPRGTSPMKHPMELLWDYSPVDDDDNDNEEDDHDAVSSRTPDIIPRTWLNAGFFLKLSKDDSGRTTAAGLAARPPSDEDDFAHRAWKDQEGKQVPFVPAPYHCRSTSLLLSIVTALLYSGATLQPGGHVTCQSQRRQSLWDLIAAGRDSHQKKSGNGKTGSQTANPGETDPVKREFERRLADALSALLHIAAEASADRKRRALSYLATSSDPDDRRKWQTIQAKLKLVPICWWDTDSKGKLQSYLSDYGTSCHVQVSTSHTNMEDLRSYVVGNMRAFTSAGGCALFLETLVRIHGPDTITRMIESSRRTTSGTPTTTECTAATTTTTTTTTTPRLIQCTCDARLTAKLASDPAIAQRYKTAAKNTRDLDTTPDGHDCVSIELLSLILTGRVHSTLQGWSTGPLGIGLLSDRAGTVGRGLTRPRQPVWILRGPTTYSVLWLTGSNNNANTSDCHTNDFAQSDDRPGTVAALLHWNCWYGVRNETQLRLVTDRSEWKSVKSVVSEDEENDDSTSSNKNASDRRKDTDFETEIAPLSRTLKQMARRRRANDVATEYLNSVEQVDKSLMITDEELQRVRAKEEDQKYYPGKHRLWSYDMGAVPGREDQKPHALVWKSYFSLEPRDKLVVEQKFGPKINSILWTRWPRAVVDRFVPKTPSAIV